jgi:exodeoxyribonuclease VII large subunit
LTSPEQPWPVRTVAGKIADWIHRLGAVWVEGQLTQVTARPGTALAFLTLRDPSAEFSLTLTAPAGLVRGAEPPLADGSRVVVHGTPNFYAARGTLSLRVDEIRPVGVGELLERIERLRKVLAAEGLFDPARKRKPPLLPQAIGLVTGRASAAERDVCTNARARWPAARFEIHNVAVQGSLAVPQIVAAISALDAEPDVEVIVLARGGGSVEDLLAFSDEALCRAVAACRTPVVSGLGHETDTPLVDHVADVRCSTPTDAGKCVVPDLAEETARIASLRERSRRALAGWVDSERRWLEALRSRPALADPLGPLSRRREEVTVLRDRARAATSRRVADAQVELAAVRTRLATLGPAATLARGYAVVQARTSAGEFAVLRSAGAVAAGEELRVRLADGTLGATVTAGEAARHDVGHGRKDDGHG